MVLKLEPCIPVPLPPGQLQDLVEKAKDYALINGTVFMSAEAST